MERSTKRARYNDKETATKISNNDEDADDDFIAFGSSTLTTGAKESDSSNEGNEVGSGSNEGIEELDRYPPWYREKDVHINGLKQLHNEILSFCDLVAPTLLEQYIRGKAMHTVECQVNNLFPKSKIQYYGSQMTKLYLPESDIDVVIMNVENSL